MSESGSQPAVVAQVTQVMDAWRETGAFSEQTLARTGETLSRFALRLTAQGLTSLEQVQPVHCAGFVDAHTRHGRPPELATRHARRTALRMLFRELRSRGYDVGDPTLDLALPARSTRAARPLTDEEIALARAATRLGATGTSLHRAVAWALAEATAVTSEISQVRLSDLDDPREPRWVTLAGARRADPRLGELTPWGTAIIARHASLLRQAGLPGSTLLTYRGSHNPGQAAAQAAVCNAITHTLHATGLAAEPDVRPASVRNWAGRRLYEGGMPVEHVARRMGLRSLDATAEDIALEWRP
ncbi:hypothetical protein Q6348_08370 [Isoptericola sp. b441]|uniref:Integrase n=1 Tax=Actinotalea lenta TaxID=3064654 RepID=A0ABT9D8I7_9CELL|nr:hypothetical protein [Isoptericola sp. b441]MDO8107208.1 hypothetical protein [Isoptericola sp. b441]